MPLTSHITHKCPICRNLMRFKAFIGAGNIQGWECGKCVLVLSDSAFYKLDEVMFSWRIRAMEGNIFR